MKKIFYLFIFLLILFPQKLNFSFAENNKNYYAKIEHEGYFYYQASEENKLFQIPTSYFVLLTGEENSLFYRATYKDISGFVKKSEVTPMAGTPLSPYAEGKFRVFAKEGLGLYSSPSSSSSLISSVPYLYNDIEFYGYMTGEEDIPNKSNQWHYCKYGENFGYLYSVFCDSLPVIEKNTESFDIITPIFYNEEIKPSSSLIWIILAVAIPSLLVLFLLLKPSIVKERILNKKKPARGRKDYFEFDDSTLN